MKRKTIEPADAVHGAALPAASALPRGWTRVVGCLRQQRPHINRTGCSHKIIKLGSKIPIFDEK